MLTGCICHISVLGRLTGHFKKLAFAHGLLLGLIKLVVAKSKGSVGREPKYYENDTPHTVALCFIRKNNSCPIGLLVVYSLNE